MIDLEKWKKISERDHLGHIAAEIYRAKEIHQENETACRKILERAFYLIDLSLQDQKWKHNALPLLYLRSELAKHYIGEASDLEKLYAAL